MPLYEYECADCGFVEEAIQKFSDPPLTVCKHCSGKLHKLISQSSFHLKGTGWYATDYTNRSKNEKKSETSNTSPPKKKDGDSSATKVDKAASDT